MLWNPKNYPEYKSSKNIDQKFLDDVNLKQTVEPRAPLLKPLPSESMEDQIVWHTREYQQDVLSHEILDHYFEQRARAEKDDQTFHVLLLALSEKCNRIAHFGKQLLDMGHFIPKEKKLELPGEFEASEKWRELKGEKPDPKIITILAPELEVKDPEKHSDFLWVKKKKSVAEVDLEEQLQILKKNYPDEFRKYWHQKEFIYSGNKIN